MKRNGEAPVWVCHWCKRTLIGTRHNRTTAAFSDWPDLPVGVGVVVWPRTWECRDCYSDANVAAHGNTVPLPSLFCGANCPERPVGAPVGARLVWDGVL